MCAFLYADDIFCMQQIEFTLLGVSHFSKLHYSSYSAFLHYSFWRQNFLLDRLDKWGSIPHSKKWRGPDPLRQSPSPKMTPMPAALSSPLASCPEMYRLQIGMLCLLVSVCLHTSALCFLKDPDGGYALQPTDRVLFHAHTTHLSIGASLGHVSGTVFQHICAVRTFHTTASGVNSKHFGSNCFWSAMRLSA